MSTLGAKVEVNDGRVFVEEWSDCNVVQSECVQEEGVEFREGTATKNAGGDIGEAGVWRFWYLWWRVQECET